jgi:hypothetical protein
MDLDTATPNESHFASWGMIRLASRAPIDLARIESGDANAWRAVGVVMNGRVLRNDTELIRKYLGLFQIIIACTTRGYCRPNLAAHAHTVAASSDPVVLPLDGGPS